MNLSTVKWL